MKKLYIPFLLAVLFASCKTELVYLSVMEPAPITFPPGVKTMGVVNRSMVSDENKKADEVDQVLSFEGKNVDADGAKECMRGLNDGLLSIKRFDEVKVLDKVELRSPGSGLFPAELSWDQVQKICTDNKVDLLLVLELFDTDSKIAYSVVPTTVKTPFGEAPGVPFSQASLATDIHVGFRIYDPVNKYVVDKNSKSDRINISSRGINPVEAAKALIGRKDAIKVSGYNMGKDYAKDMEPFWIRVSRDYYIKGNDNFRTATRMGRTGNWDGAGELWKKETNNPDPKLAGRACYNMAIISEINGDLDAAIRWSQKSYEQYNNKLALHYLNVLKNRKASSNELKKQQQ